MSKENATAAAKQPKPPVSIDPRYVGRIAGVLLGICLVVALLLGAVNQITKPKIDAIQRAKQEAAMAQVLPADEYVPWEGELPARVNAIYLANSGGTGIGWVAETSTSGSQGIIEMMVGIGMDGKVTGISVIKHSETPNIGTKVVADQTVLDRFIGMSQENGEITVNSGSNRFDAVSGATFSSRGVVDGVNAALGAVSGLLAEEG